MIGNWKLVIGNYLKFKSNHLLIFVFAFFVLTRFSIDPDFGWHFRSGMHFLQSGEVIRSDMFSWTMEGFGWGNSYFLYQVFLAFIFNNYGHILTGLVFGLIGALSLLVLIPKKVNFGIVLAILPGILLSIANLGVRPHTVSFLMFSILIVFLDKKYYTKKIYLIFWFLFFLLWANIHRAFFVGLLIMGTYFLLETLWQKSKDGKLYLLPKTTVLIVSFLGTFVTPFPLELWKSGIFYDLASRENLLTVAEWQGVAIYFPFNVLMAISGAIFVYVFLKKFKEAEPTWFIISAFVFAFAFVTVTFVFFWVAIFIFVISRNFEYKVNLPNFFTGKVGFYLVIFSILFLGFFYFANHLRDGYELEKLLLKQGYPVGALEVLEDYDTSYGLFNEYAWGGFILWRMPQTKVFIDGRMASWKRDKQIILEDYTKIISGNCEYFDKYDINTALFTSEANLTCFSNFDEVYTDSNAKILLKR